MCRAAKFCTRAVAPLPYVQILISGCAASPSCRLTAPYRNRDHAKIHSLTPSRFVCGKPVHCFATPSTSQAQEQVLVRTQYMKHGQNELMSGFHTPIILRNRFRLLQKYARIDPGRPSPKDCSSVAARDGQLGRVLPDSKHEAQTKCKLMPDFGTPLLP